MNEHTLLKRVERYYADSAELKVLEGRASDLRNSMDKDERELNGILTAVNSWMDDAPEPDKDTTGP